MSSSSSYAVNQPDLVAVPGTGRPLDPAAAAAATAAAVAATESSSLSSSYPAYTIDDVAKELQPWLRCDASRNSCNKMLLCFLYLLGSSVWVGLVFGGICNSIPLGITFMVLCMLWAPACVMAMNVSPEALQFYVEHPEMAQKIGKDAKGFAIFMGLSQGLITAFSWVFVVEPFTRASDTIAIFGEHAPTLLTIWYWASLPLIIVANCMTFMSDVLPPLVNTTWKEQITHYLERVAHELLDVETGKHVVMARLAAEQSRAEAFAINMNKIMSTTNGNMNLLYFVWIFAMLVMLGVPSNATGATRGWQVGLLGVMSSIFAAMTVRALVALTGPNRHWEHEKKRLLNDPRVQSLVGINGEYNFERFDTWLDGHELSALRAFGIPVTQGLTRKVGSILVSTFAVVMYVVLREELRGLVS